MNLEWFSFFIMVLCHQCYHATEAKNCTEAGRFPNNLSNDCRGYTMCLKVLDDFTRIDLVCPKHTIYSHIDSQCTNITSYKCLPEQNCTIVGDFPNPTVSDCGSYISCAEGMGSIVTARLTVCPPGTLYNPTEHACVNNTLFECTVPTTEPPIVETSAEVSPQQNNVNSLNNACCNKTDYLIFLILLIIFLFNKI